jgi:hypothetical protein
MIGIFRKIILMSVTLGLFAIPVQAQTKFENTHSLEGLKEARVYFDVSVKDDDLLAVRMELIDRTVTQIEQAGLKVTGVIGIRGGASRFITTGDSYVLAEELDNKRKIQEWVKRFADRGLIVEQCAIAAEIFDIQTTDFLPEVTVVGNGYISLVGYQAKGYSVVPMD